MSAQLFLSTAFACGSGGSDVRDVDNDGISDADEGDVDSDGDGMKDFEDPDSDNDGLLDELEAGDLLPGSAGQPEPAHRLDRHTVQSSRLGKAPKASQADR